MNKLFIIYIILSIFFISCKKEVDNSKIEVPKETFSTQSSSEGNKGQKTFGETTEEFLESLGGNEELKNDYLKKLKAIEGMNSDSTAIARMIEGLIAEAQQRENLEKGKKEAYEKRQSGNMDDLTAAFEKLNAESGVNATIDKLKKVDSITGQDSFKVLDIDQQTVDKTKDKADNPNKETPKKDKMTGEEMDMIRAFAKAKSNLHNTEEVDKLQQLIENTDLEKMAVENKITEKYAVMQGNEFKRALKRLSAKKSEATKAKNNFKRLNPDLYFGDEVGMTYFGNKNKAVYLPLGKLSFADKIISYWHPDNLKTAAYTLGEPDAYTTGMNSVMNAHSMGLKGTLVVKFEDNALVDVNGPDLYIFELGQIEPTNLEISKDGNTWIRVGEISGGVAEVDIHDFVEHDALYYYVRLTDLETKSGIPGADVDAIAAIGSAVRLNLDSQVLFDTGKSELKPEGKIALKELAKSIMVLQKGNIIVEGHTDDIGSAETNKQLSLDRARSVGLELKKIIHSTSFKWVEKGLGESKPLVENNSEENRAKNRRVELLILPN